MKILGKEVKTLSCIPILTKYLLYNSVRCKATSIFQDMDDLKVLTSIACEHIENGKK